MQKRPYLGQQKVEQEDLGQVNWLAAEGFGGVSVLLF